MHRMELIGNHCDCEAAQRFARGLDDMIEEELELDIEELIEEEEQPAKSCNNCVKHDACHFDPNGNNSGVSDAEKVDIANTCAAYIKAGKYKQKDIPF